MSWQRARTPEQKEARRDEILQATAELVATRPVREVSLNAIARAAGLSKSNVYRYFASREEVLLTLLADDVDALIDDAVRTLRVLEPDLAARELAQTLTDLVLRHERFARLLCQMTSVIERNVTEEALAEFKLSLMTRLYGVALLLENGWPHLLAAGAGADLLRYVLVMVEGLWPQKDPPEVLRKVMARPELAPLHVPFRDSLVRGVTLLIEGLSAEADEAKS